MLVENQYAKSGHAPSAVFHFYSSMFDNTKKKSHLDPPELRRTMTGFESPPQSVTQGGLRRTQADYESME